MSNFLERTSQIESRIGHYATRLFRVEAHVRRGEPRAARKRLEGLSEELEEFEESLEFPIEMTFVGGQLGFFSGGGHLFRGRLPAAVVGAAAGWLYGHGVVCEYREAIAELKAQVADLEQRLAEE